MVVAEDIGFNGCLARVLKNLSKVPVFNLEALLGAWKLQNHQHHTRARDFFVRVLMSWNENAPDIPKQ